MISDFLCPCHGPMKVTDQQARENGLTSPSAREIIKAGKNRDGWWKSEDMVRQLKEKAIPIFNILHPGCIGFFLNFLFHISSWN